MRDLNRTNRGFTIIELLVAFAVISILVAISLLVLGLNPMRAANEAAAIAAVRSLVTAEKTFWMTQGRERYGDLDDLGTANLIDAPLASGERRGYRFAVTVAATSFTITANPLTDRNGTRSFFADDSGIIRAKTGSGAGASDPPLGD